MLYPRFDDIINKTHPNTYEFLSSVELQKRTFENSAGLYFVIHLNEWGMKLSKRNESSMKKVEFGLKTETRKGLSLSQDRGQKRVEFESKHENMVLVMSWTWELVDLQTQPIFNEF